MAAVEADIPSTDAIQASFGIHRKHGATRAIAAASHVIWAAYEPTVRQFFEIAARQHQFDESAVNAHREAVAARRGNYREDAYAVEMRGSIAVLYVEGTIFRYSNLFTYYSGGCAVATLAKDFQTILDDSAVTDIVLYVNSGGGMVDGINEFANMVYAARGRKRIWGYVSSMGCSAAYWIVSACDRIIADDTAILGSIGVRCVHVDDKKALEMEGLKEIPFISNQSPNKCPDPATPKGASAIQQTLNRTADVFISAVARNRAVTTEQVIADFGAGGTSVGIDAVTAGLADTLGSFEGVLAELSGNTANPGYNNSTARANLQPASSTPTRGAKVMAEENTTGATKENDEEEEENMNKDKKEASAPPANPTASSAPAAAAASDASAELKAEREARAKTDADLKAANERIAALELKDRTARFTALAQDFIGGAEAHLPMMEHLAATAGEDSPLFTGYVESQSAAAEQVKEGALFAEKGKTSVDAATGSAEAQLEAKAAELMKADGKLTKAAAMTQAIAANTELYRQHVAEQQAR